MKTQTSIYESVTEQIIQQLESGVAPWQKPWSSFSSGMPANVSGRTYRGINVLLLWNAAEAKGYDSNTWGTFNQWRNLGGYVNRGEKGTKIVFWRVVERTVADDWSGEKKEEKFLIARQFTVFNRCQCGGDRLGRYRREHHDSNFIDFGPAEVAIAATNANIRYGGSQAFFSPAGDYIQLPLKVDFNSEAEYYSTTLHELVHWSGHEDRLHRIDKLARFGDRSYAAEELVAELGSAFLAAQLGIPNAPIQNNAAYLKHWLEVLRSDSRAIFTASTAAANAADFILSFSREREPEEIEGEPVLA